MQMVTKSDFIHEDKETIRKSKETCTISTANFGSITRRGSYCLRQRLGHTNLPTGCTLAEKCEATLRIASRKIVYRQSYLKLLPTQVSEEMPMQHQETDRRLLRQTKARDARLASPCTEGLVEGECGTSCSAGETSRQQFSSNIFKSIVLEMHRMREADGDETTRVFDGSSWNEIPEFARI